MDSNNLIKFHPLRKDHFPQFILTQQLRITSISPGSQGVAKADAANPARSGRKQR